MSGMNTVPEARRVIEQGIREAIMVARTEGSDETARIDDLLERLHAVDELVDFVNLVIP